MNYELKLKEFTTFTESQIDLLWRHVKKEFLKFAPIFFKLIYYICLIFLNSYHCTIIFLIPKNAGDCAKLIANYFAPVP